MLRTTLLIATLGLAAAGCGKSPFPGFFTGTSVSTQTSGGSTSTSTETGVSVWIVDGSDPGEIIVFLAASDPGLAATVNGSAFNLNPGQQISQTATNSTSTTTFTSGSGNVADKSLSMNVSFTSTSTSSGNTSTGTGTLTFTGTRE